MRRLVMWDIDHTLLYAGGVGQLALAAAFTAATGLRYRETALMAGRTDRDIAAQTFTLHGVADYEPHLDGFFDVVVAEFLTRRHLVRENGHLMPGVPDVLTTLGTRPHVVQTLVTGNLRPIAEAKLAEFGLTGLVDVEIGGYGTEDVVRATLVRRSLERATARHGEFGPADVFVVGDTVHDVTAALANGVTAIAVATGGTTAADLAAAGAHVVLDNLADVEAVVHLLAGPPHP